MPGKRLSVRLGVTLGDGNGVGPEIALRATLMRPPPRGVTWVLVGDPETVAREAKALGCSSPPVWEPRTAAPPSDSVVLWSPPGISSPRYRPGRVRADAGRASAGWVRAAAEACGNGLLQGIVTGPICKESWHNAGVPWPGHTEALAELAGVRRFAMLLIGGGLRVALATRHVPLRDVPSALTRRSLSDTLRLTCEALPWLGCRRGRVAVCGLNPHAGDGGVLGDEERTLIRPVIAAARRRGFSVSGPVPADVVFYQAAQGAYDAVLALYHDQGLAPLKLVGFETGVNITLGLPWVRTSPDHGTAFDRAGRGTADARSMEAAADLAVVLARRRNPWA